MMVVDKYLEEQPYSKVWTNSKYLKQRILISHPKVNVEIIKLKES